MFIKFFFIVLFVFVENWNIVVWFILVKILVEVVRFVFISGRIIKSFFRFIFIFLFFSILMSFYLINDCY